MGALDDVAAGGQQVDATPPVGRAARLFRNDQTLGHHWLRVRLRGDAGNPDAIGARVEVVAGERRLERRVMPTRSYLSQVESTLTFGLSRSGAVDTIRVRWPDGVSQTVDRPALDTVVTIRKQP